MDRVAKSRSAKPIARLRKYDEKAGDHRNRSLASANTIGPRALLPINWCWRQLRARGHPPRRSSEHEMKATNFLQEPGLADPWAKLAHALAFYPQPAGGSSHQVATKPAKLGIFERLDRWFWKQHVKE